MSSRIDTPYKKTANPTRRWKILSHTILIILNVSAESLSLLPHTRQFPVSNLGPGTTNLTIFRNFLSYNKPTRCTKFSILFWNETLHISNSSSVHHQEFFTVHTAMVYVIQVCWQLASRSICSCSQAVSKPVWHIPLLCVQWKTPDDGQRNCPKYVKFHSKINLKIWCI